MPRLLHLATTTSTPSWVLLLPLNAPWPAPLLPWSTIFQTTFLLLNIRQTNQGLMLTLQLRTKLLYSDSWLWSCFLSSVISMHAITYQPYAMPPCFLFSVMQRHSEYQGYHLMRCTIIVPEQHSRNWEEYLIFIVTINPFFKLDLWTLLVSIAVRFIVLIWLSISATCSSYKAKFTCTDFSHQKNRQNLRIRRIEAVGLELYFFQCALKLSKQFLSRILWEP